jgi:hypothetical protein
VRVLGVGFSAATTSRDTVVRESMFMVSELCAGGTLRDKVLAQMAAGRKVRCAPHRLAQECTRLLQNVQRVLPQNA